MLLNNLILCREVFWKAKWPIMMLKLPFLSDKQTREKRKLTTVCLTIWCVLTSFCSWNRTPSDVNSFLFHTITSKLLVWLSTEVVAYISLPALPFFPPCLLLLSRLIYWRDSLCTALQTRKLWIWSTGLSARLIPSSQGEVWVLGNLFVLTGRSRPDIRGMHGRGGKLYVWRLFLWRTLRISTFSAPW